MATTGIDSSNDKWYVPKGDLGIWIIVLILAMISLVAVFSSSSFLAIDRHISKTQCLLQQLTSVGAGLVALYICYRVPMRWYRNLAFIVFGASVVLLLAGLLFGEELNGANRGVRIFNRTIQVFEPAKVALILYLARAIEFFEINTFKRYLLILLLPVAVVCGLIIVNSFSSAVLFGVLSLLIMWVSGINWRYLAITVAIALGAVILLFFVYKSIAPSSDPQTAVIAENQEKAGVSPDTGVFMKFFNRFGVAEKRVESFFHSDEKEQDAVRTQEQIDNDRQSENAKIAIREGGIFGVGPGNSNSRYYLSMAFSDFIYAFIIEEYGLIGGIFVLLLYLVLFYRCVSITQRCKTTFSSVLVIGLALLIIIQAMLHILVNVRLLPITGHTLPLISHGGTAYLVLCGAVGMILSVSRTLDNQDKVKAISSEDNNER